MVRFLHTSDWQIGKPFARIADPDRRAATRAARIRGIERIAELAKECDAAFVVVAGDLFDAPRPDGATVLAALAAIGTIPCPVIAIPGNHDHSGPASVWSRDSFARTRVERAPNLTVLASEAPFVTREAVLLPCPLARRQTLQDPFAWLRDPAKVEAAIGPSCRTLPRIVLAHGSVHEFASRDEEDTVAQTNLLDLDALPEEVADYVALGDWHAPKQVGPRAWYSGTHEPDRFPKGADYDPGHALEVVLAARGALPQVVKHSTSSLRWHVVERTLEGEPDVEDLARSVTALLGGRVAKDLLSLTLRGSLGLEARRTLDTKLSELAESLLRLDLEDTVLLLPSEAELGNLASDRDPLLATVTARLRQALRSGGTAGEVATVALRELHTLLMAES